MAYQFRGWTSTVIEIAFEFDEEGWGAFVEEITTSPMHMFATVLPIGSSSPTLGAVVEGQQESQLHVRLECPNDMLADAVNALHETCRKHFPPPPAG